MQGKKENYTIRIPVELREELQAQADKEGRSLANYIIYLLWKAVDE